MSLKVYKAVWLPDSENISRFIQAESLSEAASIAAQLAKSDADEIRLVSDAKCFDKHDEYKGYFLRPGAKESNPLNGL